MGKGVPGLVSCLPLAVSNKWHPATLAGWRHLFPLLHSAFPVAALSLSDVLGLLPTLPPSQSRLSSRLEGSASAHPEQHAGPALPASSAASFAPAQEKLVSQHVLSCCSPVACTDKFSGTAAAQCKAQVSKVTTLLGIIGTGLLSLEPNNNKGRPRV